MQETALHAALKNLYTQPGDQQEIWVDGFIIDVVQQNRRLVEVQTSSFSAIKPKLIALLPKHRICLVHPIAIEKWIVLYPITGDTPLYRRKSPRHGKLVDIFQELVSIPDLLAHPNLELEVALIQEEEIRRADGRGSWRRKGVSITDHRLLGIKQIQRFNNPQDLRIFLPQTLPQSFTSLELSQQQKISRKLAGKLIYSLRALNILKTIGKRGKMLLYAIS